MIVDASVALKWIVPEIDSDRAVALLEAESLSAPSLVLVEVANALWKIAQRGGLRSDVDFGPEINALSRLVKLVDHPHLAARALELAIELQHPVYDCLYLALAEEEDDVLVTADLKLLARLAGTPHEQRARALSAA